MNILLNQLGYLPNEKKVATCYQPGKFQIFDEKNQIVFSGETEKFGYDEASGEIVYLADFSNLSQNGTFYMKDESGNLSYHFQIDNHIYENLHDDLIKALYFQRCGCALEEKYAGIYQHKACHMGWSNELWTQKEKKDMTGGWHDAGDYGRYITPGATTVAHILYAYLLYPDHFQRQLQIPESGNGVPDALNECRYELEWMLKMQLEDGSVYHKLTALHHAAFVMPEEDLDTFYMYPVSSMATGAFAGVMALAYRVYGCFDREFADQMLLASKKAYDWLLQHPDFVGFQNPEGTNTGDYRDRSDMDERMWASAELWMATKEQMYQNALSQFAYMDIPKIYFGWADVSGFAALAVLTDPERSVSSKIYDVFYKSIIDGADRLVSAAHSSGFGVCMEAREFGWGSNGAVGNKGILLLLADYICPDNTEYRKIALEQIHYMLGRNATDYSYVTGYGEHAFCHPHNRPTESADVALPMAGWVSGGANGYPCDEAAMQAIPKGTPPMKCFLDDYRSYSTNEISIYWNSAFIFLVSAFCQP